METNENHLFDETWRVPSVVGLVFRLDREALFHAISNFHVIVEFAWVLVGERVVYIEFCFVEDLIF